MAAALPDWGCPLEVAGHPAFAAEGGLAPPLVLPDALRLAEEPDGMPAFRLHALRALPPAKGIGRLDLRLRLSAPALPGAEMAHPARGWLRLRPAAALGVLPEDLLKPVPLDWNGLGLARLSLPLSAEGAAVVEGLLTAGESTGLGALAEMEVEGLAPRLPLQARLDVRGFLAWFVAQCRADGTLARAELQLRLGLMPESAGIALAAPAEEPFPGALALALLDRLRARGLVRPAPSPEADGAPALRAPPPEEALPDRIVWDLAEPMRASRPLALVLDPVAAARELAARQGGTTRLVSLGTVASVGLGFHRLVLDCNLPPEPAGALGLGARLCLPASPPARPQAIQRDMELRPGAPPLEVPVRLAPGERLRWTLQGFAFLSTGTGQGVERLLGEAAAGEGPRLLLTPALMPLRFIEIEAEPAVLALGALSVRLEAQRPGGAYAAEALLERGRASATLGLPRDAVEASLHAGLRGPSGAMISLPAFPAEDRRIALHDLPGTGPREIRVEVRLRPPAALAALDLLPEDAEEGTEPATLAFTPAEPARAFRWLCRDPFRPGLLWRRHAPGAAWSAPERGAGPLVVALEDAA